MIDDPCQKKQILRRIADALGTDTTCFSLEHGNSPAASETIALLRTFERIVDPSDRRACLNFVRAVAERQQSPS